jgi:hypothetical protein
MPKPKTKSDGRTITVRVPISIRKRGGRKVVLAPSGEAHSATLMCRGADNAMIKALARAFRWREMLETGTYATITEMAHAEHIDHGYLGRILRLSLLAPDLVEAIVAGRQPEALTLGTLMHPRPADWEKQRSTFRRRPPEGYGEQLKAAGQVQGGELPDDLKGAATKPYEWES